jgi:hypothetical protein
MLLVEAGYGVHLIATCLLNARISQMSVAEIYEWLAQKYPEYSRVRNRLHILFFCFVTSLLYLAAYVSAMQRALYTVPNTL